MMRRMIWVAAALLAGCGGGGSHALPAASATSGAGSAATTAKFTIAVPQTVAASTARNAQYISASTQSVVITLTAVNGASYTASPASIASNLTPSNAACSSASGQLTCTVLAPAVAGSDTFTVTTYDALQTSASPATPTGNVLSTASLAVTVVAGQANAPATPLVLGGVPASYTTSFPADVHIEGSQAAGYQIAGNWNYALTVTAYDADGNIIVGPGTPALTVQPATSAISATSVSGTNTFSVAVKKYSATPVTLTIGASTGASTSISIAPVQELWVTNSSTVTVNAYALWPGSAPALLPEAITGLASVTGIAFDSANNLWIGDRSAERLDEYPAGGVTLGNFYGAYGAVTQIAFDASDDLWSEDNENQDVYERAQPISPVVARTVTVGTLPFGLAFDPNGDFWVSTTDGGGTVTQYTSPSFTAGTAISDPNTPYGLAFDGAGDLWIANFTQSAIVEYAPPYTGAIAKTVNVASRPIGIAFDFAGNLWVTNGTNAIAEFTTPSFAAGTTIADAGGPFFIAFTP